MDTSVNITSDDDSLVLEDESGRIELTGNIPVKELVTGIVIAVQGAMLKDGAGFHVDEWYLPGIPPQLNHQLRTY